MTITVKSIAGALAIAAGIITQLVDSHALPASVNAGLVIAGAVILAAERVAAVITTHTNTVVAVAAKQVVGTTMAGNPTPTPATVTVTGPVIPRDPNLVKP